MTSVATGTPTHESYGWTYYARWVGACPACKQRIVHQPENPGISWHIDEHRCVRHCDRDVKLRIVVGRRSDKRTCDARCTTARRGDCECSCGGANHGIGN